MKKVVLTAFVGFAFLFGCSQADNKVEAGIPEGFKRVSKTSSTLEDYSITTLLHTETKCYYAVYGKGGMVQMLNKDGMPYCEE